MIFLEIKMRLSKQFLYSVAKRCFLLKYVTQIWLFKPLESEGGKKI